MPKTNDNYITVPLNKLASQPIGKAKFQEPVFKLGKFQNMHIEVEVTVYPDKTLHPQTRKEMTPVRFGSMNAIRFIESEFLYDFRKL